MSISIAQIRDLLFPGLRAVQGEYPDIPTQWSQIYDKGVSKQTLERSTMMRFLGTASIKNEGAATAFDNGAGERFVYNQEHVEIGLGYAITRKAIDDNLYKEQFNPMNLGLTKSFKQTKEILAAAVLNTGTVYNASVGGDGVALFSTAHPIDGNVNANTFATQLDLNESALEQATIAIQQYRDQAGLKMFARGRKLIVPIQLQYVAERLLKSELRPGTANNDVNAILSSGAIDEGYQVMNYLTSQYAWYMRTSEEGLNYLDRVPFEIDMQVDPITGNLLVIGYERYSFNYSDPLSMFASTPTA